MPAAKRIDPAWAREQLWRMGRLRYKLRPHQPPLYDAIRDGDQHLKQVIKCARRFGKTFSVILYCIEEAIRRPGVRIRYAAPTEKSLRAYVKPNMRVILSDCPPDLRPRWNSQDSCYVWPNGSELYLAGTDKEHAEKLRGPGTDIGICDEAGSMDSLRYVVDDILLPGTLDNGGRLIVISTPAKTPDHDFTHMCAEAKAEGALVVKTVWDNTWLTSQPALLAKYMKASGGKDSTTWRREYECEDVVDEALAIFPEGAETLGAVEVDWRRPSYYDPMTVMDVGFSPSHTFVGYGYYDFRAAKVVVEDESELLRMRTDVLATAVKEKEAALWPEKDPATIARWSDIEPILLNDLAGLHKLYFTPTSKDLLDAMVNKVRIWFREDRIRIHPRCKSLLAQISVGIWKKNRSDFEYSSRFGHYDGLAMLVYFVRNVNEQHNPYPKIAPGVTAHSHWIPAHLRDETSAEAAALGTLFKGKGQGRK